MKKSPVNLRPIFRNACVVILLSCGWAAASLSAEVATPKKEWIEKMYSNSYEEHGTKDPRWDSRARAALSAYLDVRGQPKAFTREENDRLVRGLTNVMAAG